MAKVKAIKKPKKKKAPWNLRTKVTSALRKIWRYSPMRNAVLKRCQTGEYYTRIAKKSKKEYRAPYYFCEECLNSPLEKIDIEHLDPVVALTGFETWDIYIYRLMVSETRLKGLCKPCHKAVGVIQTEIRKANRKTKSS